MSNRVVHFEIHAENPARAMKFYTDIFGWKFTDFSEYVGSPYFGVETAEKESKEPGINGGLMLRKGKAPEDGQPVNAYACTVQVEHIDEIITKIEAAGGTLALAKHALPGMAWQAYYKDTEGNIFGIHQADTNAK